MPQKTHLNSANQSRLYPQILLTSPMLMRGPNRNLTKLVQLDMLPARQHEVSGIPYQFDRKLFCRDSTHTDEMMMIELTGTIQHRAEPASVALPRSSQLPIFVYLGRRPSVFRLPLRP